MERQEEIRSKGFDLTSSKSGFMTRSEFIDKFGPDASTDYDAYQQYAAMRAGLRTIDDAVIDVGTYRQINTNFGSKKYVLEQISKGNSDELRKISDFYYNSNGIYRRAC